MYTNSSCTLYLSSLQFQKVYISKAFLAQKTTYSQAKQGLSYSEDCVCMFQTSQELTFNPGKDFLIDGDVDVEVDISTDKAKSETLKRLKSAGAKTIMLADYKNYGTTSMRHWELSCS